MADISNEEFFDLYDDEKNEELPQKDESLPEDPKLESVSERFWIMLDGLGIKTEKRGTLIGFLSSDEGKEKARSFLSDLSEESVEFQIRALLRAIKIGEVDHEEMFFDKPSDEQMTDMKDAFERILELYKEKGDFKKHVEYIRVHWTEWFDLMSLERMTLSNYILLRLYLNSESPYRIGKSVIPSLKNALGVDVDAFDDSESKKKDKQKLFRDEYVMDLRPLVGWKRDEGSAIARMITEENTIIDSAVGCDRFGFEESSRLSQLDAPGVRYVFKDGIIINLEATVDAPVEVLKRKLKAQIESETMTEEEKRANRITSRRTEWAEVEMEKELQKEIEEIRKMLKREIIIEAEEQNEDERKTKVAKFLSTIAIDNGVLDSEVIDKNFSKTMDFDYKAMLLTERLPSVRTIENLARAIRAFMEYISRSQIAKILKDPEEVQSRLSGQLEDLNKLLGNRPYVWYRKRKEAHYVAVRRMIYSILIDKWELSEFAKSDCFSDIPNGLGLFAYLDKLLRSESEEFYEIKVKEIVQKNRTGLDAFSVALFEDNVFETMHERLTEKLREMYDVLTLIIGKYDDLLDEVGSALYSDKTEQDVCDMGKDLAGITVYTKRSLLPDVKEFLDNA